jgi:hypothetical protein
MEHETEKKLPTTQTESLAEAKDLLQDLSGKQVVVRLARDFSPTPFESNPHGLEAFTSETLESTGLLGRALQTKKVLPQDHETIQALEGLKQGIPIFAEVDIDKQSRTLKSAAEAFEANKAGVAIRVETTEGLWDTAIFDTFPALQRGEKSYRVLVRRGTEDLEALQDALPLLTLPSGIQALGEHSVAIIELVEDATRPRSITQEQLDDWLNRYDKAGVDLDLDIGEADKSLDNFLLRDGKLFWCDGNIMGAEPSSGESHSQSVMEWKQALARFVIENEEPPAE